jgi:hypothetical protein
LVQVKKCLAFLTNHETRNGYVVHIMLTMTNAKSDREEEEKKKKATN